jgi:integral membrane protein (TIGR01906 family)
VSDAVAADGLSTIPSVVRWLAGAAFVIAVPIFLILGNILDVASDRAFYMAEFDKYRIRDVTRLDSAQLTAITEAFITYLRDPGATLEIQVTVDGVRRPLFNEKEMRHMVDVQHLFQLASRARLVAGGVLLIVPLVAIGLAGGNVLPRLGALLVTGGVATVLLLGAAGLLSLVDFTEVWTRFHYVAFSNDDWMLDPRTDYLIMLYPEGFWFDAVMRIAMQSALEAIVLAGIGVGTMYFGVRRS